MSCEILSKYYAKKDNTKDDGSVEFLRLRGGGFWPLGMNSQYVCMPTQQPLCTPPPCISNANYNMVPAVVYVPDNPSCCLPPIILTCPNFKKAENAPLNHPQEFPQVEASSYKHDEAFTENMYNTSPSRDSSASSCKAENLPIPVAASTGINQVRPIQASAPYLPPPNFPLHSTSRDENRELSLNPPCHSPGPINAARSITLSPIQNQIGETSRGSQDSKNDSIVKVTITPTSESSRGKRNIFQSLANVPASPKNKSLKTSTPLKSGLPPKSFTLENYPTPYNKRPLSAKSSPQSKSHSISKKEQQNNTFKSLEAHASNVGESAFKSLQQGSEQFKSLNKISEVSKNLSHAPTDKERLLDYEKCILGLLDLIQKKKQDIITLAEYGNLLRAVLESGQAPTGYLEQYKKCKEVILKAVDSLEADVAELKQLKALHGSLAGKLQLADDDCVIKVEYNEPKTSPKTLNNDGIPLLQTILVPSTAELLADGYDEEGIGHMQDANRYYQRAKDLQNYLTDVEKNPVRLNDEEEKQNLERMMHSFFRNRRNALEHYMKAQEKKK